MARTPNDIGVGEMIEEDPSKAYRVKAREEETREIDDLQPFVITEGLGEASGSISIMPLSNFMWMGLTTCILLGIISLFLWTHYYPKGQWVIPVGLTLMTVVCSSYTIFKAWEALHPDH